MTDLPQLLQETAMGLRRRFEQAARPEGLTLMQWRALGLLDRQGPMRQVAMGEALDAAPMTISALAERLSAADLVTRAADPQDSRAKTLTLTPEGAERLAAMRSISDGVFARVFADFTEGERESFRTCLQKIKSNLADEGPAPAEESET
ncbi:MarR family winged helix-turn-helix transcriptional regulator [Mesobaculum littorinae]|nr:MarR family transcriptional regulator [Mesobaculum littorinae]